MAREMRVIDGELAGEARALEGSDGESGDDVSGGEKSG